MKKTLLLFLLLPFLTFAQGLSGDYIISSENLKTEFQSLSSALKKLEEEGFAGPVKFLLAQNQTITSQYIINKYKNSSKDNTLTIKPYIDKDIEITIKNINTYTALPAIFLFNGASNVIIDGSNSTANTKNLTLINTDNINSVRRSIIWIASNGGTGSNNITIKNTKLKFSSRNQLLTLLTGVYSGSNQYGGNNSIGTQTNTSPNSDIFVINNEMFNVKDGININGNSNGTLSPTGWIIQRNKIGNTTNIESEKPVRGIYMSNALNYEISDNTISGIKNTENQGNDCAGIVLLGTSSGTISGNKINNIENIWYSNSYLTAGILVKSSGVNTIANNIISNVYTPAETSESGNIHYRGHNIFIESGSTTNIYYNTIISSGGKSTRASCLYITGGSGINVRNNIFVNTQSGIQYSIFKTGGTLGTVSHNNYYVTNSANGFSNRIGTNEYIGTNPGPTGLEGWNTATSDTNSTIINPSFTSDYHLQDVATNKNLQGIAILEVTNDIDGEARIKPYMGADELAPCIPTQDPAVFGVDKWNGYVYKYQKDSAIPNIGYNETPNPTIATYVGTVTENAIFDRDVKSGAITGLTSNFPCEAAPSDFFLVRYRMRTSVSETGLYNFAVGGDDAIRLYINGEIVLERWGRGNYSINSTLFKLEANKDYEFVIDYFEVAENARTSFSFGLTKGDPTQFGDKVWNVYGYNGNDLTLQKTGYAGYYVDPNPNANSTAFWPTTKSPYAANNWQGAPMPNDYFTVVSKRRGFACGQYQIQVANQDDDLQIFVDGIEVFKNTGSTDTATLVNKGQIFTLNSKTKIEIRLKENAAAAKSSVIFINVPNNGNGSSLVITANTELSSDLTVCSCTINDKATLTVKKDVTLTVDENINVLGEGKLLILDGGSLLQTSTSKDMFTGGSSKAFEIQRTTNVVRYDVTYWSSPVIGLSMHDLSPETLYDKFHYWNPANNSWIPDNNGAKKMEAGNGYSIRAPQPYDLTTPKDFTAKFTGTPNNGNIPVPLVAGNLNLLGNPYPSSIDAEQFIRDNGDVGPLYFWSHNTPPKIIEGTNTYTYDSSDFAVFSLMGETQPSPKGHAPDGYIAAGQGFFVIPKVSSVLFTNDQRVKANNTSFFKTSENTSKIEKNRLWLNLTNSEGAFKQMLVGYATGATNSLDHNYDATTRGGNSYIDFYSISESRKLTIQGRALPFDNTDIVSLGYKSTIETNLTISIDHADGFFTTQEIYLEDKALGKIIDLRKENYTFKTAIGSNTTRFVLRYTNKTLGTDDFENLTDGILVAVKSKVINVASGSENIKEVKIFSIGGQLLYSKNKIEAKEYEIANLYSSNQVLLVKVILENDHVVTKKIIFN